MRILEFKRILQWHVDAAWPLTFFKKSIVEGAERVNVVQYEGAPSFTDIINCACGTSDRSSKSYKRFAKDVKERLIECMFPEGALFYQQTKRRERVKFDEDLRNMVEADFLQMHDLFSRGWTPKVKQTRSCSACSLRDLCLPELRKMKSAKAYIEERLKESGE